MKKKLGLLAIILVLLTLAFSVNSCDDGGGSSSIEGKWQAKLKDTPDYADAKAGFDLLGISGDVVIAEIVFSNGVFTMTSYSPKTGTVTDTETGTYTVSQDGKTVTMTSGGGSQTGTLSGNKFTITDDDGNIVFTRA